MQTRYAVISLRREDIVPDTTLPRAALMHALYAALRCADRKRGCLPIAVLPNPLRVLRSRQRVLEFQHSLLAELHGMFAALSPQRLFTRGLLAQPPTERYRRHRRPKLGAHIYDFGDGMTDAYHRQPHFDVDSQLWVSMCYFGYRDIRGGTPRFLDLRMLAGSGRLRDMRAELNAFRPKCRIFATGEACAALQYRYDPAHLRAAFVPVTGLDYGQMPIVFFSNRAEDGVMHGATAIRKTGPHPRRCISYASIGYRDGDATAERNRT